MGQMSFPSPHWQEFQGGADTVPRKMVDRLCRHKVRTKMTSPVFLTSCLYRDIELLFVNSLTRLSAINPFVLRPVDRINANCSLTDKSPKLNSKVAER